jgi:hypothetical protein
MPAMAARTATVLPVPTSPVMMPTVRNPAEFHQMHDLKHRDLRTCADGVLRRALRMWR